MNGRVGSLCSGFGGLDLGLERAGFSVAWHAELDPHCSAVLKHHWPGVPNHGNLKTINWGAVEPVTVLCGGYPCQPFSHAGRRRGEDDPRHLWPFVCTAIRQLRPRLAILENVAGHRSLGFGRVLGDLAEVGYDATWASLRASDVGAPHGRERVFILAAPSDAPHLGQQRRGGARGRGTRPTHSGHQTPPDAKKRPGGRPQQHAVGATAGSAAEPRERPSPTAWDEYEPAIRRWEAAFGEPAPDPLDERGRLNVDLTRWMMGFPPGWHGALGRTAALRGYGNAVQVQVAEYVGRWAA